ncbi:MAG: hypothetical protein II776_01890 [Clostridia bacterium]|nr:hypothetical protein [Clostridia bacterium]
MKRMKFYRAAAAAAAVILLLTSLTGCGFLTGQEGNDGKSGSGPFGQIGDLFRDGKVKVTPSSAKSAKLVTFDNGMVSLEIPEGWRVEAAPLTTPSDILNYTFTAFDPDNTDFRLFFSMKLNGFLKTEEQRRWYASMYPQSIFAQLPSVDPQTTERFFNVLSPTLDWLHLDSPAWPRLQDLTAVASIGTTEVGGEIIRAAATAENGRKVDGVFTAAIKEVSLYYVTSLNVYNVIFFTAPENLLTDWEDVLNRCVASIRFSDAFVSAYYQQEETLARSFKANQKILDETSEIITRGWEARQASYDVISQKQSDATMGYERVYDTETCEIYKADNGFMDHDWNGRYEFVTDDMYKLPTAGYIERVE